MNYRQYRGDNLIEFNTSDEKPITIIEGTTGAGKTTILNAIYWCLYGEEPSFHGSEQGVAPICNRTVLAESKATAEMSVELAFGESEPKYFFKRKLMIWNLDKVGPSQKVAKILVQVAKSERETTIYLNENLKGTVNFDAWTKQRKGDIFSEAPDYQVDNILPHDLAFVFFFNGEELKEFFEKKNLQKALEDISQITLVKTTIDELSAVGTDLRREASKGSVNTEVLNQSLTGTEGALADKQKHRQSIEGEIAQFDKQIEAVDAQLKALNIERVTYLVESRSEAVRRGAELAKDFQSLCDSRDEILVETAPLVYLHDQVTFALRKIGEFDQKGKLPPPIRTVFLKDLLEKGVCICGRSFDEHGPESGNPREQIQKLLDEESSDEAVSFKALDGRFKLEGILASTNTGLARLAELGERTADKEAALIQAEEKAKSIGNELQQYESPTMSAEDVTEKIRSLQSNRSKIEQARSQALSDLGGDKRDIARLEEEIKSTKKALDKEVGKDRRSAVQRKRWELCEKSLEILTTMKDNMISEVRSDIQRAADAHFRDLVWKTTNLEKKAGEQTVISPEKLQRVEISDDNEIRVITKNGENWIRSLSQGETQTLSYSFISALKEGARVVFPMIVDTPLGIIDEGPPRELFAELLPDFVQDTQLIFLMTSAEYTPTVRRIMGSKVGRAYRLSFQPSEGATKVEKVG